MKMNMWIMFRLSLLTIFSIPNNHQRPSLSIPVVKHGYFFCSKEWYVSGISMEDRVTRRIFQANSSRDASWKERCHGSTWVLRRQISVIPTWNN